MLEYGHGGACTMTHNDLLASFSLLTDRQKQQIIKKIEDFIFTNELIDDTTPNKCPYCSKEDSIIKKGKQNNKQDIIVRIANISLLMILIPSHLI